MNIRILFIGFLFLSFITACSYKKRYRIEFKNVNGLKENADVIYKGQEIGSVDKIELNESRKIIVTLEIANKFALPENSKFVMVSRDFLGTRAIEVRDANDSSISKSDNLIKGVIENMSLIDSLSNKAINLLKTATDKGFKKQDSLLIELRRLNTNIEELKRKRN